MNCKQVVSNTAVTNLATSYCLLLKNRSITQLLLQSESTMECIISKISWAIRKPGEKQKVADKQKTNFLSAQQSLYQQ